MEVVVEFVRLPVNEVSVALQEELTCCVVEVVVADDDEELYPVKIIETVAEFDSVTYMSPFQGS